jgi:hypothetical protein
MSQIPTDWLLAATAGAIAAALVLAFSTRRSAVAKHKRAVLAQLVLLALGLALLAWVALRGPTVDRRRGDVRSDWQAVGNGITEGISGLAFVDATDRATTFIAVHDNKQAGQKRLSVVERSTRGEVATRELAWKTEPLPIDLEAVCRVPGEARTFLALTSRGALYRFTWSGGESELTIDATPAGVPNAAEDRQFETFDVRQIGAQTFACWAERGAGTTPGVIFCATFDAASLAFGEPQTLEVRAPWPESHTRHIADLRVLSDGTIIAASASDPGDNGPFASAVYIAASLQGGGDRPMLVAAQPFARLLTTTRHKIDALELAPGPRGGLVVGSDDENAGASLLFTW